MATAWCIWETWFIQPLLLLSYFLMEHKPSSIKYLSLNHLLQLPPCSAHIIHLFLILFPMCLTLHLFLWPYGFQGKSLSSYTIYNFYHNNVSYHKQARFLSQYMSCTMNKPLFVTVHASYHEQARFLFDFLAVVGFTSLIHCSFSHFTVQLTHCIPR